MLPWLIVFAGTFVWLVTFFGAYLWGHSVGTREGYIDGRLSALTERYRR